MSLTLEWDSGRLIYTAAAGQTFTTEVRTKTGAAGIVTSVYNQQTQAGPKPVQTAVADPKTVVVVYEATSEGSRVELWEINGAGEEQLLTYRYHQPGRSYFALQIN